MIYSAKHKASGRYSVITPDNQWLEGFLGTKEEAEAKAEEMNLAAAKAKTQKEQTQNDKTDSVNDSDNSNTGINSTSENEEQTEQVISDSGLEQTSEDDTRARAFCRRG